ncbi:uncharacterized protein A4U43_C02F2610 [Asparagus officinalis]|uniref:SUF system FeS cluster assembly SufBD core domain-containing protein n=1 Tax=Asparagus officinalis TaxID=4686 RepID=A0A5P1FH49_ASPOF|nr:uncharacterized protein A4U43_C02F2610 [Asparagus officinalis]
MLRSQLSRLTSAPKPKRAAGGPTTGTAPSTSTACSPTTPRPSNTSAKLGCLDDADPKLTTLSEARHPLMEQERLRTTSHRRRPSGVPPEIVRRYRGERRAEHGGTTTTRRLILAFSGDGSFCYVPRDTVSPMEISTYFRINDKETGQFERTLIVAEENSFVSYLEGCTAPQYDRNQLHAAVVELWCAEGAEIKYSTVQNWYHGDEEGKGGIFNFVTKRGRCYGARSKISWTQVETGSAITWKYPSVELRGDDSVWR